MAVFHNHNTHHIDSLFRKFTAKKTIPLSETFKCTKVVIKHLIRSSPSSYCFVSIVKVVLHVCVQS